MKTKISWGRQLPPLPTLSPPLIILHVGWINYLKTRPLTIYSLLSTTFSLGRIKIAHGCWNSLMIINFVLETQNSSGFLLCSTSAWEGAFLGLLNNRAVTLYLVNDQVKAISISTGCRAGHHIAPTSDGQISISSLSCN